MALPLPGGESLPMPGGSLMSDLPLPDLPLPMPGGGVGGGGGMSDLPLPDLPLPPMPGGGGDGGAAGLPPLPPVPLGSSAISLSSISSSSSAAAAPSVPANAWTTAAPIGAPTLPGYSRQTTTSKRKKQKEQEPIDDRNARRNRYKTEKKSVVFLDDFDIQRPLRPLLSSRKIRVPLDLLREEMLCSVCLSVIQNTMTVMECLHRFCSSCIEKSLRHGLNECPKCRIPIPTKRSMRPDPAFDSLISLLVGNDPEAIERAEQERVQRVVDSHMELHREHSELVQHRLESQSSNHRADAAARAERNAQREKEKAEAEKAAIAAYVAKYGHLPPVSAPHPRPTGRPRTVTRGDYLDDSSVLNQLHLPSRREIRTRYAKDSFLHYQALTLHSVLQTGPPTCSALRNFILCQPLYNTLMSQKSTIVTAQSLSTTVGFYCTERAGTPRPYVLARPYIQTPSQFTIGHLAKYTKLKLMEAIQRRHQEVIAACQTATAAAHTAALVPTAVTAANSAATLQAINATLQSHFALLDEVSFQFELETVGSTPPLPATAAATAAAAPAATTAAAAASGNGSTGRHRFILAPTFTIAQLQQSWVAHQPPPPPASQFAAGHLRLTYTVLDKQKAPLASAPDAWAVMPEFSFTSPPAAPTAAAATYPQNGVAFDRAATLAVTSTPSTASSVV